MLWARDWSLLCGATAVGTALVLAVYFGGLAAGAALAARTAGAGGTLTTYATLELALGGAGVAYVAVRPLLAPAVAALAGAGLAGPALLAVAVLGPPATLLGATLPAACAALDDARGAGRLYAWNTLGGAVGALATLAGIRTLGVRGTFLAAAALDVAVGLAARRVRRAATRDASPPPARATRAATACAAVAGFAGLAGEVLWTRGLAGVLSNSIYSVALVLAAVLTGIVAGARFATRGGARAGVADRLALALGAAGLAIVGTTVALRFLPDASLALARAAGARGPTAGLAVEAALALAVVVAPATALGAAFPLALALDGEAPRRATGRILAANTAAGIAGALAAAFVLLPRLGLGPGLVSVAALVTLAAVAIGRSGTARTVALASAAACVAAAVAGPTVRVAWRGGGPGDALLFYRDGTAASVMVTEDAHGGKRLRVDGQYSLGGTDGLFLERREAAIPLLLHPAPARMLALGVGTADTLGAALAEPALRIDAVELLPEVLDAARLFAAENRGALDDRRVTIVADDARRRLLATDERWDVVLADLFLPWRAGTASLYSTEFYRLARARLRPGGIFCQWLPLHQLGTDDVAAIVATFAAAFPETQVWLAYHRAAMPIAALVGSETPIHGTLRPAGAVAGLDDPTDLAALYVADGVRLRTATAGIAPITDDRPRLEFTAPAAYFHQEGLGAAGLAWLAARLDPGPAPVAGADAASGSALVRAALLRAALALAGGDRFGEAVAYLDALALAPASHPVRQALAAIARERIAAGDPAAAIRIGDALAAANARGG